jgi:fructose/tagatose bisphosphate aldolase
LTENVGVERLRGEVKTRSHIQLFNFHDRHHHSALQSALGKYAVGAYNINKHWNSSRVVPRLRTSKAFIIQLSKGARKYADKRMLEAMIRTARPCFLGDFAVHLDHGDEELVTIV